LTGQIKIGTILLGRLKSRNNNNSVSRNINIEEEHTMAKKKAAKKATKKAAKKTTKKATKKKKK
jgi:mannose/fructose/N-acetylgalactosamine-specific phosphotransferase system component IIB